MSPLLSTPVLLFLSLSPALLPPFPLTLLPEFCSESQSDHLPPAPQPGKRREIPLYCRAQWWWWVLRVHEGAPKPARSVCLCVCQVNDQVQSSSTLTNTNMSLSFQSDSSLIHRPDRQSCQSLSSLLPSLPPSLLVRLTATLFLCIPIRPVGPHFSCLPLLSASLSGRVLWLGPGQVEQLLSTGGADRWSRHSVPVKELSSSCCGCTWYYYLV